MRAIRSEATTGQRGVRQYHAGLASTLSNRRRPHTVYSLQIPGHCANAYTRQAPSRSPTKWNSRNADLTTAFTQHVPDTPYLSKAIRQYCSRPSAAGCGIATTIPTNRDGKCTGMLACQYDRLRHRSRNISSSHCRPVETGAEAQILTG